MCDCPNEKRTVRLIKKSREDVRPIKDRQNKRCRRWQRKRSCMCGAKRAMLGMDVFLGWRARMGRLIVSHLNQLSTSGGTNFQPGNVGAFCCMQSLGNRRCQRSQYDRKTCDPGSKLSCDFIHSHRRILSFAQSAMSIKTAMIISFIQKSGQALPALLP